MSSKWLYGACILALWMAIAHHEDRLWLETFRKSLAVNHIPLIHRAIRKDGVTVWLEHRGVPVLDKKGNPEAFEGVLRDITDRWQLEQDMSRLDGLNAIGQMAASIAHEIRNPLTIRGYLQLLGIKAELHKYEGEFRLLIEELDRANALLEDYLALGRHKSADFKLVQLNSIVEALVPLLEADCVTSGKSIRLELTDMPPLYLF